MKVQGWTEVGGTWDADHGLLDESQVAECRRADVAEPFPSPVPTRMVSNGEYMPVPQTSKQTRVERRIRELSADANKRLGIDRRNFLASSGGMVAAFLAMNEVFGRMFNVDPVELFEPAAYAQSAAPRDLFVFDDQLHFVRGTQPGAPANRAIAQAPQEIGGDPAFIQKDEASRVERRGSRRPLRAGGRDVGAIVFGRAYRFF